MHGSMHWTSVVPTAAAADLFLGFGCFLRVDFLLHDFCGDDFIG